MFSVLACRRHHFGAPLPCTQLPRGCPRLRALCTDRPSTPPARAANRGFAATPLAPAAPAGPTQRAGCSVRPALSSGAERLASPACILLLDISAMELLTEAATQLARAHVPADIFRRARNGTPHSIAQARWQCAGHSNWRRVSPPRVQNARQTMGHHVRPRHTPRPIHPAGPSWH